jgi:hypothetical protein
MKSDDFDEILKETELDSAKMIFRLTSELKEKKLELADVRAKSFDEIQRNNKAKEAEFEALIQGQEGYIKKREAEISRLLVDKEAQLWEKHQLILEEAIAKHRAELEEERARLKDETARKEGEILEQKKNLRLEMESLFKKWELEREEDFKNERKTFIEELKLGRDTARKEAEERAKQMEELWKEKLAQDTAEIRSRHELGLEEMRRKMRQEHLAELKGLNDRLNCEFSQKEQKLLEEYAKGLSDNKRRLEDGFAKRVAQMEATYGGRISDLEGTLKKSEEELTGSQTRWEEKLSELKKFYDAKAAALEDSKKENQSAMLASEKDLDSKQARLEKDLLLKTEKMKSELARREHLLETEFAENSAALQEQFSAREKLLAERETKLAAERESLNLFRNQMSDTIRQREAELTKAFEDRYSLLKEAQEESARVKELGMARKYEEAQKQFSILAGQKDAALARITSLNVDNEELKRLLAEKDAHLRKLEEREHANISQLRTEFEKEFDLKAQALRSGLAAGEETARKNFDERLKAETVRLAEQYRIKETGLAAQRDFMNAQAEELEGKFIEALKIKETENSENLKKMLETSNTQLENARRSHAMEMAESRRKTEENISAMRSDFEGRFKEKDLQHEQQIQAREKQAFAAARRELELENKKLEELHHLKIRDMEGRHHTLEQNLRFALETRDAAQTMISKLKEEIEIINNKLDATEHDKQKLIQENISLAKDIRREMEKEFISKLENIEKNYLVQMADTIHRSEDKEKTRQDEYFKKLEFIKEEYNVKLAKQAKDLENSAQAREDRLRAALEDSYKLKLKALATRYEQMERNYDSVISDKTMQLDNDRSMAEGITRLKSELEARNRELNSKIAEHDKRLEEARKTLEASYAATTKELENDHRIKTAHLENDRSKLKALLEQEQRLVADLQKREAVLQETYAAKEASLIKEFSLSRERLENGYQIKLKAAGGGENKE